MGTTSHLSHLQGAGLIRQAETEQELEYLFRHALVQEATYTSLLRADRKALHRAVGETLERLYPDRLIELAARLGLHFSEAGDDARALKYLTMAGDAAARVYANAEAVMHYGAALDLAKPAGDAASLTPLYLRQGRVLELAGRYDEALASYADMEAQALALGDRPLELAALMELTKLRAIPSVLYDPPLARVLAERTLALARALGDRATEARVLWLLLILNLYSGGGVRAALQSGEQALALARELDLRELLAFILNDIWYAYLGTGHPAQARAALGEAAQLWMALNNIPMLAANASYRSILDLVDGALDASIAASEEGFQLAGSVGNGEGQVTSRFLVILAYAEAGRYAEGLATMEHALALGETFGLVAHLSGSRAELAWAYGQIGATELGLGLARQADAVAESRIPPLQGWTRAILARLLLLRGETNASEAVLLGLASFREVQHEWGIIPNYWIGVGLAQAELALARADHDRAIVLADELYTEITRFGVRPFRADLQCLKGRALLAKGNLDEAYAALSQARADAEAIGSRRMHWPVLAALSELEDRRGRPAEALALRAQAWPVVAYIADHCPPELRDPFLHMPLVQSLRPGR